MDNLALSLIRTYVPLAVGAFVAWLLTLGVDISDSVQASVVVALTGLLQAIYYTAVRLLESKFPVVGKLLGASSAPKYKD